MDNKNLEKSKKISYWNGAVHYNFSKKWPALRATYYFFGFRK